MEFETYSKELNTFSFLLFNEKSELFEMNEDVKERIILSRLYYALLHHFFEQHQNIALSTASGKHETVLRIVKKEHNLHFSLFLSLKKLREWADYHPHEVAPFPLNLSRLLHQVNRVIN